MPKKRGYKKRRKFNRPPRVSRGITKMPTVYKFKREVDELVALTGTPDSWTLNSDNSLAKTFAYALNQIGDYDDYQNLFKYYRIKGARVRMYFSNTGTNITSATTQNYNPYAPNSQIMVQTDINQDGVTIPTLNKLLCSQTKRRFVALQNTRKPSVDIYMPLKQAVEMYASSGNPTALCKPKWLNCLDSQASQVPHYGLSINLGRMDGGSFSTGITNNQYVRIITTLYIECKKVQ